MERAVKVVEALMQAAGQEMPRRPMMTSTAKLYFGNPDDLELHVVLLGGLAGEEIAELGEAWMRGDDVRVFDAALQVIWAIIAGLRALGFPIEEGWAEIERANRAKIDPITHVCLGCDQDGRILKPSGWRPPDLRAVLDMRGFWAFAEEVRDRTSRGSHSQSE
jgi:hypothetical protein